MRRKGKIGIPVALRPFHFLLHTSCFILLLSGCVVGPRYYSPCDSLSQNWKWGAQEQPPHLENVGCWWEVFEDPCLNQLEECAICCNQDLEEAVGRFLEARSLARAGGADLWPEVTFDASFDQKESLFRSFSGQSTQLIRFRQEQFDLLFNFDYEVDLWGKICRSYASARARAQAAQDGLQRVLLSITADLAENYFLLRSLDAEQEVLQETIARRGETVEINRARFGAGLISAEDVTRAQTELAKTEAESLEVSKQRALLENLIALLSGEQASRFCLGEVPLEGMPPKIPSGVPSELLLRRPDIAEMEREMAAEHQQIGVEIASLFPSITLTGASGFSSPEDRLIFDWDARFWTLGVNLSQSIFSAGKRCANIRAAQARYLQALARYRQKVLAAVQEVEDHLASLTLQANQYEAFSRAVEASKETVTFAQERYRQGLVNYLDVVDAQRSSLENKRSQQQTIGKQFASTVNLIRVLGGNWQ